MSIAFTPDKIVDAKKDFVGVIVVSEYKDNPRFAGKQLAIEIQTEDYDKNQHEGIKSVSVEHFALHALCLTTDLVSCRWFAPSDKRMTKWSHLIEALSKCGALKDVNWEGSTPEEQMQNFAKSLKGMKCRFVEYTNLPSIAKNKDTGKFIQEAILPTEYFGKVEVGEVKVETLGGQQEVTL